MGFSQEGRYTKEVFSKVNVSSLSQLQSNFTVMPWVGGLLGGNPGGGSQRQPLRAQFYTPDGDTKTDRPLIIYLHTGNFIPFAFNGSCGGTVTDSSNVEIATRLAKMGYVVAVVEYRQGWLPTTVSYTHLRAHETVLDLVCRLLLEKKNIHNISSLLHLIN